MTRRRKRRSEAEKAPVPKIDELRAKVKQMGVPAYLPTPERAEAGALVVERITDTVWNHDRTGQRKSGRTVTTGIAVRDRSSEAKTRLRRFTKPGKDGRNEPAFTDEQVAAGLQLEAEWEASGLEPRMVANLLGTGGGAHAGGIATTIVHARDKVHHALQALRLGGDEVVAAVEAIIIRGATSVSATPRRYTDAGRQNAHVTALLTVGLNLLVGHYRLRSAKRPTTTSGAQQA